MQAACLHNQTWTFSSVLWNKKEVSQLRQTTNISRLADKLLRMELKTIFSLFSINWPQGPRIRYCLQHVVSHHFMSYFLFLLTSLCGKPEAEKIGIFWPRAILKWKNIILQNNSKWIIINILLSNKRMKHSRRVLPKGFKYEKYGQFFLKH